MTRELHILLIEDNEDHAMLTEMAMRDAQPEIAEQLIVSTCIDGADALAFLQGRGKYTDRPFPDLVVLDLKMPGINGFDILRVIRADPTLRLLPVVVLTTSNRREDVSEAYALGANEYVSKPANSAEFRYKVQAIPSYWSRVVERPQHTTI